MADNLTRRDVLKLAAAGAVGGIAGCAAPKAELKGEAVTRPPDRLPVVFVSHGSPMVALRPDASTRSLVRMGEDLPVPRAIVVVSAHWLEPSPIRVSAGERPETIYDFYGFPKPLYELKYPVPGDPTLAREIAGMLERAGRPAVLEERGLDHGAWVPLRYAYPRADVSVLEVTLNMDLGPAELVEVGRALAPLRDRGILLIGSGGMVHNLQLWGVESRGLGIDPWALAFDTWVREKLDSFDLESLIDWQSRAPDPETAHPTTEHFDPIFMVLGAATRTDRVRDVFEGFHGRNMGMRTFRMG